MPAITSARRAREQSRALLRVRGLATGLALGLASLALAAPAASGREEPAASFVAQPAAGSELAPAGGYFLLRPSPGTTATQALALRNDEDRPLEIRLAATDATTGALGGVSYGLPTEVPSRTGSWIALEKNSLTLAPHASATVSFTVRVPVEASAGQHLAGLAVWSPEDRQAGGAQGDTGQAGASLTVQTRRVVAVQVDVPGPSRAELGVTEVRAAARPDGMYLEILIDNPGTELTKAQGVIELPGSGFRKDFSVDTFVPGTSIAYPVKWTEQPQRGEHEARVTLSYGSERADWTGTVAVGGGVLKEFAQRHVQPSDGGGLGMGAALAAVAAAATIAGVAGVSVGRRRKRAPGPASGSGVSVTEALEPDPAPNQLADLAKVVSKGGSATKAGAPPRETPGEHGGAEQRSSTRRGKVRRRRRPESGQWAWDLDTPPRSKGKGGRT